MAYEPKTWVCGDTITADDLNRIEQAIGQMSGGGTVLAVNVNDGTLDKTWQEIYDAMPNAVVIKGSNNKVLIERAEKDPLGYCDVVLSNGNTYSASSADGYPSLGSD